MRYLFFPLSVALLPALAFLLHSRGASVGVAVSAVLFPFVALVLVLERVWPFDASWNRSRGDLRADLGFATIVRAPELVASAAGHALAASLAGLAARSSQLPLAVQLAVVLLAGDLGKYTLHRLSHERASLWRFHAVHHAPDRIYVLNGLRIHPVNMLWNAAFDVTLPLVLGVDARVLVIAAALRGVIAILQHANLPLAFGPLGYVFSTNELHRYHHSTALSESQSNYGSTLIVWDLLFGTYTAPARESRPAEIGLGDHPALPRSMVGQIRWSFCRRPESCRLT